MEFINHQHGLDYKYCPDQDAYVSFLGDKKVGKIPRKYITDPVKIWERKAQNAGLMREDGSIDFNDDRVKVLKPTQTVFKIWEHANAKSDD